MKVYVEKTPEPVRSVAAYLSLCESVSRDRREVPGTILTIELNFKEKYTEASSFKQMSINTDILSDSLRKTIREFFEAFDSARGEYPPLSVVTGLSDEETCDAGLNIDDASLAPSFWRRWPEAFC